MRKPLVFVAALFCVLAGAVVASDEVPNQTTARIIELWQAGAAARAEGDSVAYGTAMSEVLELEPGHPAAMRHLARACALQGNNELALEWLEKVARSGVDLQIGDDSTFVALFDTAEFKQITATVNEHKKPLGNCTVAFELDERDLLPEGIAYDPVDDVFYLGSVRRREILRIERDGSYEPFATPDSDTFFGVLGLRVVPEKRQLWAVTSEMAGMKGFDNEATERAGIHCFDLDSGKLKHSWLVADSVAQNINDIIVTPDGTAYATSAYTGALLACDIESDVVRNALEPGTLYGPNGLTLSADGTKLYIAQYSIGIVVMDLSTGQADVLRHGEEINVVGIDGLYYHDGALIAVQNFLGMQQVTHFRLSDRGDFIEAARILERHDPRFHDPTTGAIVEGQLFLVANSQLPRVDRSGSVPHPKEFDPTYIVAVPLP